jgi:hypothetical protein
MSKPSKKFLRESQDLVLACLADLGDASAYDVTDVVAAGKEGNEAFALRQRVSGACSELHKENRVHKIAEKTNPSSGETVNVYRINLFPDQACPCGACPGRGDAGYKSKYEQALVEIEVLKGRLAVAGFEPCRNCNIILDGMLCPACESRKGSLKKEAA